MKAILHSRATAQKLNIHEDDIIEIDSLMDSSKQFENTNKHRMLFHSTAGCFYVEKMFAINFDKLNDLMVKYNLPPEFINDYQEQRKLDRLTGSELQSKNGKKFVVRDIAEQHILQDFRGKFIPSLADYFSYMETPPWANNAVCPLKQKI